ncbi:hypothetical protein EV2_025595 [Malus domestica]
MFALTISSFSACRKITVVNLDAANDALPYECFVNMEDLIKLSDVMVEHSLGPNGGDNLEKLDGRNNGY